MLGQNFGYYCKCVCGHFKKKYFSICVEFLGLNIRLDKRNLKVKVITKSPTEFIKDENGFIKKIFAVFLFVYLDTQFSNFDSYSSIFFYSFHQEE